MKKVMILIILLIGVNAFAQRNRTNCNDRPEFTHEQMAELKTKKMTLMLDLNEEQQQKIKELHLLNPKGNRNNKNDRKNELSDKELYEMKLNELNSKIAFNEKMRSILTQEQYDLWKNNKGKHPKRKGHHRKTKG
jgi:hypothetical protein